MLTWMKQRLFAWVDRCQKREIERLHRKAIQLKQELESSGKEIQLTPEDKCRLAEKAKGIDLDTLRQISVIEPEQFLSSESGEDATENR